MTNDETRDVDEFYLQLPYTITIRKDGHGDFVAKVDELPGCRAHGRTETEAISALSELRRLWLEQHLSAGNTVPLPAETEPPPSGKWLQRVPRSLHKRLAELAKAEAVSLNQLVTTILTEGVTQRSLSDSATAAIWRALHHQIVNSYVVETAKWQTVRGRSTVPQLPHALALTSRLVSPPNQQETTSGHDYSQDPHTETVDFKQHLRKLPR